MFAEEDQFWEYSKTSLRIWGTKATWPFECFEASCALNIGFVTGDNLEAIGEGFTCGVGRKAKAGHWPSLFRCAPVRQRHSHSKSRLAYRRVRSTSHIDARLFVSITPPSFSRIHYYIPTLKWPAQHVHKNSLMTQTVLFHLIPYPLRPNQSHPQGNANVLPWSPRMINLLQSSLEMATLQIRTLTKSRRSRPRILQSMLLYNLRAPATTHLTLPPHNKSLIFSRC